MTSQTPSKLAARWIALGDGTVLEDGWIEIAQGRIEKVETRQARLADIDFGNAIILPGFVNAHTHLDLTGARDLTHPCQPFPDWLRNVIAYRRSRTEEQILGDIVSGIDESIRAGTTLIGDISVGGRSWEAILAGPLKAIVFHELIGLSADRAESAISTAQHWLTNRPPLARVRPGLSPHAPYSFRFDCLAKLIRFQLPIAIHVAESIDEIDLIIDHDGEFVPFLEELGAWDETGLPNLDSNEHPLHEAKQLLMIHGNYLPGTATISSNATMVYCPRTHAAFDHPPHPFRDWLTNGVRVALGTDSLASNPDLSVLAEARFVAVRHEDLDPQILLKMITQNGAHALGFADECGAIAPDLAADLCVIEVASNNREPLRSVFLENAPLIAVFSDGQRLQMA